MKRHGWLETFEWTIKCWFFSSFCDKTVGYWFFSCLFSSFVTKRWVIDDRGAAWESWWVNGGLKVIERGMQAWAHFLEHKHKYKYTGLIENMFDIGSYILLTTPIPSFFPNSTLFTFWEDLKALTPIPCQIYLHSAFTASFKSQKRGELYLWDNW